MEADFSGYATKAGLKCSDGRTITAEAFKHMDGQKVPLVWQHSHNEPNDILGHALLEARDDGVYTYAFFNDTESGKTAKGLVLHGDITMLSIYANQLVEKVINSSKTVLHGMIREVSLVLSGANPGAKIDYVRIAHTDDPNDDEILTDEAIIHSGTTIVLPEPIVEETSEVSEETELEVVEHADGETVQDVYNTLSQKQKDVVDFMLGAAVDAVRAEVGALAQSDDIEHAGDDITVKDVYNSLSEVQKKVVHFMIGTAVQSATAELKQSDIDSDNAADKSDDSTSDDINEETLNHTEGTEEMKHNVFESNGSTQTLTKQDEGIVLSHSDLESIVADATRSGSLKEAVQAYALAHSITDIDVLFPDAQFVTSQPDLISRRTEWVKSVIDGAKHSPFARIKSWAADLTADEARAKGYVKGNLKKEEIIRLLKRVTTPTTIYKKQKLDRDDVVDAKDFDVVSWLKWEMRFMLEEEIARAILVGDGREPDDEDKIDEEKLRPIAWDNEMYAHPITVPANTTPESTVESIIRARKNYKGTGRPTLYTTDDILVDLLLIKDRMGRFVYDNEAQLAAKLRVSEIVVVEVMEDTPDLLAVMVNMNDYTIGADRGGAISMFDDFDIDYNQQKYLIETRISGALTKPKSAVVIKRTSGTTVVATVPTFDPETNTITIPTVTGVTYYDASDDSVMAAGDHVITETTDVYARANTGYNFGHNTDNDWTFGYTA